MQPLSRVTADELSSVIMENELLRYEIAHVRARLAAAEKSLLKATKERALAGSDDESAQGEGTDTARADLVWLLTRLDASPLGRMLARRPRMVELRRRYLSEAPR